MPRFLSPVFQGLWRVSRVAALTLIGDRVQTSELRPRRDMRGRQKDLVRTVSNAIADLLIL